MGKKDKKKIGHHVPQTLEEEEELAQQVIPLLREKFGDEAEFETHITTKTNESYVSIAMSLPGWHLQPAVSVSQADASLTIEDLAELAASEIRKHLPALEQAQAEAQAQAEEVAEEGTETAKTFGKAMIMGTGLCASREDILSRVVFQALGKRHNQHLAETCPHVKMMNLIGVFRIPVGKTQQQFMSVLIKNDMAEDMGLTVEELAAAAERNTPEILGVDLFQIMPGVSVAVSGRRPVPFDKVRMDRSTWQYKPGRAPQFMLTNHIKINGAGLLFVPQIMRGIAEKCDTDYYIVPSSIHAASGSELFCKTLPNIRSA